MHQRAPTPLTAHVLEIYSLMFLQHLSLTQGWLTSLIQTCSSRRLTAAATPAAAATLFASRAGRRCRSCGGRRTSSLTGRCGLCGTPGCVIINAFPHLLRALTRAIYPQKTGSLCTPPQQADDFVNGQACAVLYLTGLGAGSLVSVSKIVHHMKLNMKVSSSPGAEGRRGAGMANSRLLRCCAGLLFPCGGSAVAAEARAASGGTQTGEGAVRHLHCLLQEVA